MKTKRQYLPAKIGERFGRLVVLEKSGICRQRQRLFICQCDCGKIIETRGCSLRSGNTTSCGCYGKEKLQKIIRLAAGESSYNYIENRYMNNARNKGIPYEISREHFRVLIAQNCHYCGSEPQPCNPHYKKSKIRSKSFINSTDEWAEKQWIKANGIDRVNNDPNIGYTKENAVPCCAYCNHMKCAMTVVEFIEHSEKITNFQNKNIKSS